MLKEKQKKWPQNSLNIFKIMGLLPLLFLFSCSQNPKEKTCKELYGVMKDCFYANTFDKNVPCNALSNLSYKTALKEGKSESIAYKFKDACYMGCTRYKMKLKLHSYESFKKMFCNF